MGSIAQRFFHMKRTAGGTPLAKTKTLFSGDWISLCKKVYDTGEYEYMHEQRCGGNIVAVLPYRRVGRDAWKYGVRREVTPAWSMEPQLSALTGGVEEGMTPEETAIKELEEESGLRCTLEDLEPLGTCFGSKASDAVYHLFAVDADRCTEGTKSGDGTKFDDEGTLAWIHLRRPDVNCAVWNTMALRLGLG